jgi:hypothetical protein
MYECLSEWEDIRSDVNNYFELKREKGEGERREGR